MSIAQYLFWFAVLLIMMFDAVSHVATGIGGCWWPISARAVLMEVPF